MTDDDFLTRIRKLQAGETPLTFGRDQPTTPTKQQRASVLNGHKHKADPERSKPKPNMVVSVRIDPARITLAKLRFMGEVPDHLHLLEEKEEPTCQETQWAT